MEGEEAQYLFLWFPYHGTSIYVIFREVLYWSKFNRGAI